MKKNEDIEACKTLVLNSWTESEEGRIVLTEERLQEIRAMVNTGFITAPGNATVAQLLEYSDGLNDKNERLNKALSDSNLLLESLVGDKKILLGQLGDKDSTIEILSSSLSLTEELRMKSVNEEARLRKELEEAWKTIQNYGIVLTAAKHLSKEIDHTGAPKDMFTFQAIAKNMKVHVSTMDWSPIESYRCLREGESNQWTDGSQSS